MQRSLLLLFVFFTTAAHSQQRAYDKYESDTFRLGDFYSEKIVAYKIEYVTVYVDYKDYKRAFDTVWKRTHKFKTTGLDGTESAEYRAHILNLIKRGHFLDSIHNLLIEQQGNSDTIYLADKDFAENDFSTLMDLDIVIENGNCAIADENNVRQYTVIRKKGSWYRGPLNAFGGRQYFLPGRNYYFYEAMDWIS